MRTNEWKYLECDFYEIFAYGNEKWIHIDGYVWPVDYDDDHPYRNMEYAGFELPLNEFLSEDFDYDECRSNGGYVGDCTEIEALDILCDRFDGEPIKELPYGKITMDTPLGYYVDYAE